MSSDTHHKDESISLRGILSDGLVTVLAQRSVLWLFLAIGVVVAVLDWLLVVSPVPRTTYAGLQSGLFTFTYSPLVSTGSRVNVPLGALVNLDPTWLAITVARELFGVVVVGLVSAYALTRLVDRDYSVAGAVRYTVLLALFEPGIRPLIFEDVQIPFVGLLLVGILAFYYLTGLFVVPLRVALGESYLTACRRSWTQTNGHKLPLAGVIVGLGFAYHLALSIPFVGPVATGAVAALHAGTMAVVFTRVDVPSDDESPAAKSNRQSTGHV